jgi:hypothetical protein
MNCTEIVTTLWASPGSQSIELSSTYVLVTYWRDVSVSTGWSSYENTTTWPYLPWPMKYNPCNPYLSIPAKILSLDPHWQYCLLFFKAMHDPPTLLAPENGFFPVTTTSRSPESPHKTNAAMTAQAVQQTVATKTPAPETQLAPGTKPTNSPPGDSRVVQPKQPAVITVGQITITANSASAFVIGTQTLAPGQQITAFRTLFSMAPDGENLFLGGSSVLLEGGGSKVATATGVDGVGAGEMVQSNSASGKREGDYWVLWKIALCVVGVRLCV